jgi:hypothetical protein
MLRGGLAVSVSIYGGRNNLGDFSGIATGVNLFSGMPKLRELEFGAGCSAPRWQMSSNLVRICSLGVYGFGL